MQYTVSRGEKGKVEIKVDVAKAEFLAAYNDALEALGKDAKIAGFRPGKVPRDVLEGNIGTNKILNEAASFLISKHLSDIFKKENISPLGNPSVAVHSLAKDASFSFTATVISKPKVKVGDWKKIKVKRVAAKEVTNADVEESIKNIYEAWINQKSKIKNQKSKIEEEGKPETSNQKLGTKFIYDAHGNKLFFDEKRSLRSSPPEADAGLKINDEFAKAIGARDLVHLGEIVQKDLEQIVADQVEAKLEEELFGEILKISEVEVPDILVDDEVNRIMIRLNSQIEQQGRKMEDYLREQNTTLEALRAKFRPQAEKNVKVTLIMDEIGRGEKVQVAREEVDTALKNVNQADLSDDQKKDLEQYLAVSILQAKTLEYVKKTVAS